MEFLGESRWEADQGFTQLDSAGEIEWWMSERWSVYERMVVVPMLSPSLAPLLDMSQSSELEHTVWCGGWVSRQQAGGRCNTMATEQALSLVLSQKELWLFIWVTVYWTKGDIQIFWELLGTRSELTCHPETWSIILALLEGICGPDVRWNPSKSSA